MELDALNGEGLMTHAHDCAVAEITRDLEYVGQTLALDDERVVTCDLRTRMDVAVDARTVVAETLFRYSGEAPTCLI